MEIHKMVFKNDGKEEYKNVSNDDFFIGKKYALYGFMNEEETMKQLKDFEDFCSSNGIDLR